MSRHKASRYELGEDFPASPAYMVVYPPREVEFDSQSSATEPVSQVIVFNADEMRAVLEDNAITLRGAAVYELTPMRVEVTDVKVTKTVRKGSLVRS